ncbi:MAG: D-alanyl-D-alanine carboxypeptidase/D-alanyl-D-alanine-endopeptidase [Bacteroidetes bacterium GWF2_42_66]|nr:MAG: D-alanyl-D-alanine carboxypeptidase/D-alanyl-D-alanine-endopeptidase [Bacteroidetes bacterium GWA2_42_15]OFY02158.1 MAG: D-alanyl-D-alanine carboxypeptidase/D-alanyl-D-alanine-endopeptidase [Bacteroidetes bacterium GWE2_42_39]OFY43604.1 MAG: D-alanyl-D-alanine carboxypeptidase/D-alanyl-D-alanine-endopeptidase [Bacteroidetes bacterium GWF2_42_66]HBL75234.1 D-alanyl-D-alanine carboxypeptidase/D-alanyl-D-alanine-endopeptidase [Prolixibacteraceae bacterium]HCR92287.1 D-alanyl-D-alanine carb
MKSLKLYFFIISAFVFISAQSQDNSMTAKIFFEQWKNVPEFNNASIGISVMEAGSGNIIIETTPQLSLVPASLLKIVTSAAALEILGPHYCFETRIDYSGEIDAETGTLNGDLIIVGGGDPALGSMYFKDHYLKNHFLSQWIKSIQEKGIKKINGNIIADASIYEQQMIPNTWVWEDLGNYYGAGACGLSVYDNLYEITLQSGPAGNDCRLVGIEPEVPGLEIENAVKASTVSRDLAYVFGSPFDNKRIIKGTIPENRESFVIKASLPDPPYLLASQLKQKLKENNIQTDGAVKTSYSSCKTGKIICNTVSPPLKDIIRFLNHESVNLFAEHLCKHLAYVETGKGNTKDGLEIIRKFWAQKGINTDGMYLADGSGLSRFNAITARQLTEILDYINQSRDSEIFKQSLPTVGGSGTLYVFDKEKFPNGALRAKSGSMTRVRCYAGFLKTISGKELIFTVMLNNFSCSQSKAIKKAEEFLYTLLLNE